MTSLFGQPMNTPKHLQATLQHSHKEISKLMMGGLMTTSLLFHSPKAKSDFVETSCFFIDINGKESSPMPCKYSYTEDSLRNRRTVVYLNGRKFSSSRVMPTIGPRKPIISLERVVGEFNVAPAGKICARMQGGAYLCAKWK